MNFASTTEVIVNEKNELFNALSIYVPLSLAGANIVDFDPAWVSSEKPAVFTCVLNNYKKIMKGKLLDQWQDIFQQDTNVDVILYLIVFQDGAGTEGMWEIDDVSIKFAPLTKAFTKLFFISYVKTLFDETYSGKPIQLPPDPGTAASAVLKLSNPTGLDISIPAGTYQFNDGVKDWNIVVPPSLVIAAGGDHSLDIFASTAGSNAALAAGAVAHGDVSPALPADITLEVMSVTQGTDAGPATAPSLYFDLSLALAYLCKNDLKLSYFISLVRVSYLDQKPSLDDVCLIRRKTSAEEKDAMRSILEDDRSAYYWGALFLMGCVKNTWVLVHGEPVNIVPLIFAAWFNGRNASGQFVGNKLSLLRLRGTRIKPLGFPSWLNSEVNENDADGFDLLDAKNIGYLSTIADNTPQESCVSSARSFDGTPVAAQMISKWVDYTSAQQCAKFITDDGTVTDPVLTNEKAYGKIQDIVNGNLLLFVQTGRLNNIEFKFPPFSVARVGPRELQAARSWKAKYTDDLDTVTVTGGIVAA